MPFGVETVIPAYSAGMDNMDLMDAMDKHGVHTVHFVHQVHTVHNHSLTLPALILLPLAYASRSDFPNTTPTLMILYVFLTAALCTYAQLIFKWRMMSFGAMPESLWGKGVFVVGCLFDPFVISGFVCGFLATLCWLVAISKLNVSYAYPVVLCTGLVCVTIGGVVLFGERLSTPQMCGLALLLVGLGLFVFK